MFQSQTPNQGSFPEYRGMPYTPETGFGADDELDTAFTKDRHEAVGERRGTARKLVYGTARSSVLLLVVVVVVWFLYNVWVHHELVTIGARHETESLRNTARSFVDTCAVQKMDNKLCDAARTTLRTAADAHFAHFYMAHYATDLKSVIRGIGCIPGNRCHMFWLTILNSIMNWWNVFFAFGVLVIGGMTYKYVMYTMESVWSTMGIFKKHQRQRNPDLADTTGEGEHYD